MSSSCRVVAVPPPASGGSTERSAAQLMSEQD